MALFAEVVRAGSLSAAGRRLGISTSAVSQQLRSLEQAHGVTLLHRTTRKLSLTEVGVRFAEHCEAMVVSAARARQHLALAHDAPQGELRMSAPVGFARHLALALAPVLAEFPALKLQLVVDDAMIDLVDARIDLALRAGRLADSNWAARPICHLETLICAAPSYLVRADPPTTPAALSGHQWVAGLRDGQPLHLEFRSVGGEVESLRIEPRITSNNQFTLRQMGLAGLGLIKAVRADVEHDLRAGRLVRVLSDWRCPAVPVWAVTPQRSKQPAKVRHAVEVIVDYLRQLPGASV